MFNQRIKEDQRRHIAGEHIAVAIADAECAGSPGALRRGGGASREDGGRVLVLDAYGVVQADTDSR